MWGWRAFKERQVWGGKTGRSPITDNGKACAGSFLPDLKKRNTTGQEGAAFLEMGGSATPGDTSFIEGVNNPEAESL